MMRILAPLGALLFGFAVGAIWIQRSPVHGRPGALLATTQPLPAHDIPQDRLAATLVAVRSLDRDATLQQFAMIGENLPHLGPAQLGVLLDQLEKDPDASSLLQWLIQWWMQRDPAAAAAWMHPRLVQMASDGPIDKTLPNLPLGPAALQWAGMAPRDAFEFARQHPRSSLSAALLVAAMNAWPEQDPADRCELLRNFPAGRARAAALEAVIGAWTSRDSTAALAAAQSFPPGLLRGDLIAKVLGGWPEANARAAFNYYRALRLTDPDLLAGILQKGAATDSLTALRWLEELEPAQVARHAPVIVAKWALKDAAAALKWALERGVPLHGSGTHLYSKFENESFRRGGTVTREGVPSAPFGAALKAHREATLAWIRSLPAGSAERERWTEEAIHSVDRAQKQTLFGELSPAGQRRAVQALVHSFGKDSAAAQSWAASLPAGAARNEAWRMLGMIAGKPLDLPPGPERDAMLHGRAVGFGQRLAEPSLELVMQISDPVRRRDAFDDAMEDLIEGPYGQKEKARAWMEAADLPEDWKRPWRAAAPVSSPPRLNDSTH